MRRWWADWRVRQDMRAFRDGYDFAAGCMLRGGSAAELVALTGGDESHPFDRGIHQAVRDWRQLQRGAL